jgi:prepilin-type N-terminal cleavage/methylation domain-containing protein
MMIEPRQVSRGFTLIEIQIAILILLLIFSLSAGVLYFSAKAWNISNDQSLQQNRQNVVSNFLGQQITTIIPLKSERHGRKTLFFEGKNQSIYYVGYLPTYLVRGGPWLINLHLNPTNQLILRYKPIEYQKSWLSNLDGRYQNVVLLDEVRHFSISYLSSESHAEWGREWLDSHFLPSLLKIQVQHKDVMWPDIVQPIHTSAASDFPYYVFTLRRE